MKNCYDLLTTNTKRELVRLVKNRECGLDMLSRNFYKETNYNANNITSRFQVQYFMKSLDLNDLQKADRFGWWQNEEFEANTINPYLQPLLETNSSDSNWGDKLYSSFALNRESNNYRINFPLRTSYTSDILPFEKTDMPEKNYNQLLDIIKEKMSINFVEQKRGVFGFKKSLFKYAIAKIRNAFLKLAKKENLKPEFKGSIFVANRSVGGYKYSNAEKTVKIYDTLISKVLKIKDLKEKAFKLKTKDISIACRVLANIYMCRATNFGNKLISKKVENCLSLQFANILNKNQFSSTELNIITTMAMQSVIGVCNKLKFDKEYIIEALKNNGFVYDKEPATLIDAFLMAKENNHKMYLRQFVYLKKRKEKQLKRESDLATIEKTKEGTKIDLSEPKPKEEMGLIPSKRKSTEETRMVPIEKIKEEKGLVPVETKYTTKKENKTLELGAGKKTEIEKLESPKIAGYLEEPTKKEKQIELDVLENQNNNRLIIETEKLPFLKETEKEEKIEVRKLNKKAVSNYIDKEIKKALASQVLKTTNAINANRCSAFGGKEKAKKQAQILSMILAYYTKKTNGTLKTTKSTRKNSDTLYARSQQVTNVIFYLKEQTIDKILECSEKSPIQKGERTITYINRLAKNVCKAGDVEGMNIKDYFTKLISSYSSIYADGEFVDIYDKSKK